MAEERGPTSVLIHSCGLPPPGSRRFPQSESGRARTDRKQVRQGQIALVRPPGKLHSEDVALGGFVYEMFGLGGHLFDRVELWAVRGGKKSLAALSA